MQMRHMEDRMHRSLGRELQLVGDVVDLGDDLERTVVLVAELVISTRSN